MTIAAADHVTTASAPRSGSGARPDFVAVAREIAPILAERAPETDALRRIPDATMALLREKGLLRMLQPARYGGYETSPAEMFRVQIELASACPSTGWVLGVLGVHSWQLALFDPRAQEDVWGDDTEVLISSSYAPTGTIERVEGGFKVSGRWSFSSGCDHCDWAFLGGFAPSDGLPDMRTFLLPRSDYVIEDNWHVSGLRGTGSKDVVVDGAFVPEYRTHKLIDGYKRDNPGNRYNPSPIYRLPFGQIHVRSVSTPAIGCAVGAIDHYLSRTKSRVAAADAAKVWEDPTAQRTASEAERLIDEAKLVLERNFNELVAGVEAGEDLPIERRVRFRYDSSMAVDKAVRAVDLLFTASGGRAIFTNSPLNRFFQDVHAIRAHFANNPDKPGRNLGATLLGQKNKDFFI